MQTFHEGDTIEIPYALLDRDGVGITLAQGDTLELLIAPQVPDGVRLIAEHIFSTADAEIAQQQVTVPDPNNAGQTVTVEGYLFTGTLPAGQWVYEWQMRGSVSDDERGEIEVEASIQKASP